MTPQIPQTPQDIIPTPYHLATQRAAALYAPGHPTEAWRAACREAERAWVEMRSQRQGRAIPRTSTPTTGQEPA